MENMPFFISPPYQVLTMTCSLLVMLNSNSSLGVQAQLLVVLDLGLGSVVNNEIRLEVLQLLSGGTDEHIGNEVCLPGHFHDETHCHAGILVGAAESIHDVQALVGQLLLSDLLDSSFQASWEAGWLSFLYSSLVHHTVSLEFSSITMNLSLGERPV